MSDYKFRISLRLRHPSADLKVATERLGLEPTRVWLAATPRATPTGDPLDGVYEDSYWTAPLCRGNSQDQDLSGAIEDALDRLEARRQFLVDFCESGGNAEFFIGWFFPEGNSGDVLDWRLLEKLARMRIALSLDIYPMEPAAAAVLNA